MLGEIRKTQSLLSDGDPFVIRQEGRRTALRQESALGAAEMPSVLRVYQLLSRAIRSSADCQLAGLQIMLATARAHLFG